MHLQTHLMSGWCVANLIDLTARERFLAMLMAIAPDLDGVTYFFGAEAYWATHHVYGHNLLCLIAVAGVFTIFCQHRLKSFALFMVIGHLHLAMDLLGSGEGWSIPYFLPFDRKEYLWSWTWAFDSWQNMAAGFGFLLWCILIAVEQKRTPLEYWMPKLDAQLVRLAQKLRRCKQ